MRNRTNIASMQNAEDNLLEKYLREIASYAPLSDEEERQLSAQSLAGDERAREKLVKANLKFVVSIARQYASAGVQMLDLINEGNIALLKAAAKFDASRGQRFSTYAVWDIRKAMEAFIPDTEALIKRPDMDAVPLGSIAESARMESFSEPEDIASLIRFLPERERMVVKAFYGVGARQMTMEEIGRQYNMTRERVRQIRDRAMRRLETLRRANRKAEYL